MTRRPESRESEREQDATVAAILRWDRGRERDDRVEEGFVAGQRDPLRGRKRRERIRRDIVVLATDDVVAEVALAHHPGTRAEEEREERAEVARAVVDWRRREEEHARTHEPLGEVAVADGAWRARMVGFVEHDEVMTACARIGRPTQ